MLAGAVGQTLRACLGEDAEMTGLLFIRSENGAAAQDVQAAITAAMASSATIALRDVWSRASSLASSRRAALHAAEACELSANFCSALRSLLVSASAADRAARARASAAARAAASARRRASLAASTRARRSRA